MLALAACGTQGDGTPPTTGAPSAPSSATAGADADAARSRAVREGSVIARALEDDALFVADEDHGVLRVLALPAQLQSKRVDVRMPGRPAQVAVTGDRVLVTIRQIAGGDGALLVLRRKPDLDLEEVGRVALPADAWGIALTPDQSTALVTSAWTHRLSAVDLGKLEVRWSVDVAREPRGVAVIGGAAAGAGGKAGAPRAYVSHLVAAGEVTRVDDLGAKEPKLTRVELPASPLRSPPGTKLRASLGYSVVASPEGERVYFPRHALGALGGDAWFGAATVDVLATAGDTPVAPARAAAPMTRRVESIQARIDRNEMWSLDGAVPVVETKHGLSAPRAVAYRKKTRTLLVVSEGSDSVLELDARAMDPTLVAVHRYGTARKVDPVMGVAEHGEAPQGIALSADEDTAWVFCRATDDVVVLDLLPDERAYRTAPHAAVSLGGDEDKELRIGRALFYDGTNSTLSGGVACAGCHPEGRDDGFVWREAKLTVKPRPSPGVPEGREERFTNFLAGTDLSAIEARWGDVTAEGEGGFGYARQTPMIVGRVKAAGPYGWHGESPDLPARIKAGFGLHRWSTGSGNETMEKAFAHHLARFLREGLVPPPRAERAPTEEEQRGKAIFVSGATQCATCHVVETDYTDRTVQTLPAIRPPRGFAEDPVKGYKVPSLLYVGGSPPYMHDGRFESLESLVEYNQDRMGKTAHLSKDERAALIAFLRTL